MFKRYTIAGEANPVWQIVEPVILKTWADGMRCASYSQLYLIHIMGLLVSTGMFLGSLILRLLLVALVLLMGYALFEQPLSLAFDAVFPSTGFNLTMNFDRSSLWPYQLLGYVILIKSVLFVFGKNLTDWVQDTVLYMLMMITGMIPLQWIALGLLKENYFAQLVAKTSFMGIFMAQTILAAPAAARNKYDKIYDLYKNSNNEEKRRELEHLCATG